MTRVTPPSDPVPDLWRRYNDCRRAEDGRAVPLEGPDDPPPETFGQAAWGFGKAVWGQLLP